MSPRGGRSRASMRPRIAMVVASLDIVGGHGVQAATLAAHLRREGYPVSFVPINPPFPRGLGWVRRCPYVRTLLTQALYAPSLRRLAQTDVVHVFAASYWSFVLGPVPAILAARRLGKRVVLNYHSGEADDHLARWGRLVHPFLKMPDAIVVPSRYLRDIFSRRGYRTRVIQNVVDTGAFRYRDRVPLRPRLLSTRNLEPGYDVANTIRAMALLRGRYPEATLTVAGYGSQDNALRRLAASLGIEGAVRFAGRVEPAHMPALADEADIFVNSSLVDNQPLSVLEALAAGLPVVSTPTGAIGEMLGDGDTGILVPQRDPAAMAGAVAALLDDPARAIGMARRARQAIAVYTWTQVRDGWAAAYGAEA
jgi:glycosyltransferase involved in cell wall biosynthesis